MGIAIAIAPLFRFRTPIDAAPLRLRFGAVRFPWAGFEVAVVPLGVAVLACSFRILYLSSRSCLALRFPRSGARFSLGGRGPLLFGIEL